jgi:hypothetical protein
MAHRIPSSNGCGARRANAASADLSAIIAQLISGAYKTYAKSECWEVGRLRALQIRDHENF